MALTLLFLAAGSGAGYCATAGPVLVHFGKGDHVLPVPRWALLNPFRARAPEAIAENFLEALSAGRAQLAFSELPGPVDRWAENIGSETAHPLRGWSLRYRTETENRVELLYKIHLARDHYGRAAKFRLERPSASEPWALVDYSTYY